MIPFTGGPGLLPEEKLTSAMVGGSPSETEPNGLPILFPEIEKRGRRAKKWPRAFVFSPKVQRRMRKARLPQEAGFVPSR
jgi:hypothetical protein